MATLGLEVLFAASQNAFRSKEDALICALHWCLVSNKYSCIGKGEEVGNVLVIN